MGSNYRLVRRDHGGGIVTFGVHVVHTDEKGRVVSVTKEPAGVVGYSKEEAAQNLHRMAEAFRAPILEHGAAPGGNITRPLENIDIRDLVPGDLPNAGLDAHDGNAPARKPAKPKAGKAKGRAKKA
jgi:hypothetical protein